MKRIAVIGGGISGLVAAFQLQKHRERGAEVDYTLIEASQRFGGVIKTEQVEGCVLESGPDSFLTEKAWGADLCRELGLEDQLIYSNDSDRQTYMFVEGRRVPIPDGLMFMVPTKFVPVFTSPLFSWTTKLRILKEWFHKRSADAGDCTVSDFIARHYGREMVDRVADPLLAGVYGGSADELSAQSVLPRFVEIEAKFGSLGKAMIAARKQSLGGPNKPIFTSLRNGMQQMVDALVTRIPQTARRLNTQVEQIKTESGKWLAVTAGRTEEFDAIVLAMPAYAAAGLLGDAPKISQQLNATRYSSSVTVALVYDGTVRAALSPGFGILVPRSEGLRTLAVTFVHNKFSNRAPEGRAVIRCFLGGSRDESVLEETDENIMTIVRRELQQLAGIDATPLVARIQKWPRAMAQYGLGHSVKVAQIREMVGGIPGLALAGNAYAGIGVPDCVRSGSEAAAKILADLGMVVHASGAGRTAGT
jgi:protoporphyrinogen/coproporphyrinogen III oxidase